MAGFFAALLGVSASGSQPAEPNPNDDRFYTPIGTTTWAGNKVTPDAAMRVSAVYAAVSVLSKIVACLPFGVYEVNPNSGEEKEVPWHPVAGLLDQQPNDWQSPFDFRSLLMSHLCLRGNGLAEVVEDAAGGIARLDPIHPDRVLRLVRTPDRRLAYTIREESGTGQRVLLQDQLLHIRAPIAPGGGYWAASPIDYAIQTVGLALAAEEHGARTFAQGARPSGAVSLPGVMGDEAFERFRKTLQEDFTGLHNAGKTLILEGGGTFAPITMTAEQLQFIATRQFAVEEIARWFDVPLVMLHHLTGQSTWGTGVEAIMLAFVRNNLRPWLAAWEQAIRRDLILNPRRFVARFDIEALIRGDSAAVANFISRLVLNGVLTRNEGRAMIGFNKLAGLDVPLVPTNTTTNDAQPANGNQGGDGGQR